MMLEMKRVVLLLSVALLTCAAPLHQNDELSSSQESQVTSHVTQFRGTSGSDIIITAPAGFGKPNEKGQSTVTVSLRDENTNVSIDVVSFIFSLSSEEMFNAKLGASNGGFSEEGMQDNGAGPSKAEEKNNTDDEVVNEEGFNPTAGPEVLNSDGEFGESKEETPNPRDDKSEDQIRSTSSQSNTRVNSKESDTEHPKVFETTTTSDTSSSQEDSNESDYGSEHQKPKVHTDQSVAETSALPSTSIHEETTSEETNGKGTDSRSDMFSVEGQTDPTNSEPMLGPFQTASAVSSSSEKETDDEYKNSVTDTAPRKTPSLTSGPDSMVNTVVKNEGLPTPFFSGSDFYPEYVNDEWQYDPRYYDPYRNHPGYAAGYDPYGAGYDPYGAGYDPYGAGYDPYGAGYDPYGAGYDPYGAGYDPYGAGYDPYGTKYDPYQAGYDNQDPYHETESDPRNTVEQETTPANESHPTKISNSQDNSHSEEQPQSPSISPSSTPVSLPEGSENMDPEHNMASEEPSNSSSIETSREMRVQPTKGPNDSNNPPDLAVSNSEEGIETRATGSSSSEESVETTDSEQEHQNPMDHPGNQGTPDPVVHTSSHMSVVQVSHNTQEVHNEGEPQSQSAVDLTPAFSSEEDDPLVNTVEHIMTHGVSNEEGTVVGTNPLPTPSDNTKSENNQNEDSNEYTTGSPGISTEVTHESMHLTTESPTFDSESVPISDSLVSNEDTSSENTTPNPSTNLHITTQSTGGLDNSAEANANTANDSEETQESQIFTPSKVQHTENSSDEENARDRKSNQGIISQFPVETPAKIIASNLWTSFLQALKVPLTNQSGQSAQRNVRRPQSIRRYHQRSNRKQKANSSEESK